MRIRAVLPKALFLLPGYGYQKGDVRRITAALVPGPRKLEGGLISSSRAAHVDPRCRGGTRRPTYAGLRPSQRQSYWTPSA